VGEGHMGSFSTIFPTTVRESKITSRGSLKR
jgi:hypothetical protein